MDYRFSVHNNTWAITDSVNPRWQGLLVTSGTKDTNGPSSQHVSSDQYRVGNPNSGGVFPLQWDRIDDAKQLGLIFPLERMYRLLSNVFVWDRIVLHWKGNTSPESAFQTQYPVITHLWWSISFDYPWYNCIGLSRRRSRVVEYPHKEYRQDCIATRIAWRLLEKICNCWTQPTLICCWSISLL